MQEGTKGDWERAGEAGEDKENEREEESGRREKKEGEWR